MKDIVSYTGQEWRRVGNEEWHDSLAILENTKSKEFQKAVKAEDRIWGSEIQKHTGAVQTWKTLFQTYQSSAYPETLDYAFIRCKWQNRILYLQPGSSGYMYNIWITTPEKKILWHAKEITGIEWNPTSSLFCILRDVGKGAEQIELSVYEWKQKPVLLWKRSDVGPAIAIVKGHLYYLGIENALRSHTLWITNLKSGTESRCLYHALDKRIQLTLHKQGDTLFLHAANALFQRIGIVTTSVQWITEIQKSTLVPLTKAWYASNHSLRHVKSSKEILFPPHEFLEDAYIESDSVFFITTVSNGRTTLWYRTENSWTPLLKPDGISEIDIVHFPTEYPTFIVKQPHIPQTVFEFRRELGLALLQTCKFPEPLPLKRIAEGLAGPDKVPYYVVSSVDHPTKILVSGYGAYGISAIRYYPIRWLAYLAQGYAICSASPRGGREKGDTWYDGGRTALRKHHTFEDTATVIREVQKRLHIAPSRTLFFGRSAGGWLAARIAQEYGHLVSGVYAEVPYVDVLRTTTNPDLPLTQLEYDEFGDPLHNPAEFQALKLISPVDTVPTCKEDACPHIVIRTGINDMQVLPYEVLKWAIRLRQKRWPHIYVGIDHNGGHFAAAADMNHQRAEDAALLDASVKPLNAVTRRSASHKRTGRITRRR